ncbi:MAG: hypothetical protein ABIK37_03640 [candidate division WOR-3 bacterium]
MTLLRVACPYCSSAKHQTIKTIELSANDTPVAKSEVPQDFAALFANEPLPDDIMRGVRRCSRCRERFYILYSASTGTTLGMRRWVNQSSVATYLR